MLRVVAALATLALAKATPTKLIIDTDIGGGGCNDVDDVIAVSIANALADNGEAELLAVVQNTAPVASAGAISVLNHYYGRDAVAIGAYNISTPGATLEQEHPLPYVTTLVSEFSSPIKNSSQMPDAVDTYRRVLAAQPSRSVAISSIGILTNLAALLRSLPDKHSALDGKALVGEKVFLLAVMGGKFPASGGSPECNVCGGGRNEHNHLVASAASSYVAANWPTTSSIIWSGFEVGVQVQSGGAGFQHCPVASESSPVKAAMVSFEGGPNKSRFSWDPLTTLVAVRSIAGVPSVAACTDCDGTNSIDANTGQNTWVAGPPSNQTYLILADAKAAGDALDALLCQTPAHSPPPPPPAAYTRHADQNCFTGHGGEELDIDGVGSLTVEQCESRCDADVRCECVTYQASVSTCWKRASCVVANFEAAAGYDTYVRTLPRTSAGLLERQRATAAAAAAATKQRDAELHLAPWGRGGAGAA